MKKIKSLLIALTGLSLFLISCQSTSKSAPVSQDSYDGSVVSTSGQTNTATKNESEKKEKKPFISYGNKGDYTDLGETTCFSKNSFGVLGQKDGSLVLYTKDNTAGLGHTYQGIYYFVLFDEAARAKITKAYNQYLSDFENKKLDRKGKKTYKAYGSTTATLRWGTLSNSTPNYGSGAANIGYEFEGGSPYFTITVYPVYNKHFDDAGESVLRESFLYHVFFTKAQGKELIDALSPETLNPILNEYKEIEEKKAAITADEY